MICKFQTYTNVGIKYYLYIQVPGRLGLLVTLYLIASNVYGSVQGPNSRGFSFIEIWMVGIQITILLAIFEYAIVLVLKRKIKKKRSIKKVQQQSCNEMLEAKSDDPPDIIKKMDEWTMISSAIFFIIFNICYWMNAKME